MPICVLKDLNHWWLAARPRTLPAALVPVALGTALAYHAGVADFIPAGLCLLFALLVQVGTNFANDYFDFVKGADTERRIGPRRAVASGWVTPEAMRRAMFGVLLLAFLTGLPLAIWGGAWLLLLGGVCLLFAYAYTGGPFPLAYHGLGDVFVFIFFGLVATAGTFYVQAGGFAGADGESLFFVVILAGTIPGALATNILVVNNMRDAPTDAEAGKRTLVVRFGVSFARLQYVALSFLAMIAAVAVSTQLQAWTGLVVVAFYLWQRRLLGALIFASKKEDWGSLLSRTAAYLLAFGAVFSAALIFDRISGA
ncbi:MAG: 1,4-dihydroxy-2-naphthoate polyprenyltransferase [Opitutales bacterium]|nr:1,4-dihydroxy-2-naphthoate polyprenyltransferase [Opitutales bacterium]